MNSKLIYSILIGFGMSFIATCYGVMTYIMYQIFPPVVPFAFISLGIVLTVTVYRKGLRK